MVDGSIYGVPTNSKQVLRISAGEVELIGEVFQGDWTLCLSDFKWVLKLRKWHGGVLCGDGCIYGIPCNAQCILKIADGKVSTVAQGSPLLQGRVPRT